MKAFSSSRAFFPSFEASATSSSPRSPRPSFTPKDRARTREPVGELDEVATPLGVDDGGYDPLGMHRVLVAAILDRDAGRDEPLDDPLEGRVRELAAARCNDPRLERVTQPARSTLWARSAQREDHEHITMGHIERLERVRHGKA